MKLSVREMETSDAINVVNYFHNSTEEFLHKMGAIKHKLPAKKKWLDFLIEEVAKPLNRKSYHYIIWEADNIPIGHSNVNFIEFGKQALMHLHIWDKIWRQKGIGLKLLELTIPKYFDSLELQQLLCSPFAHNTAPNRTLVRMGFDFVSCELKTPGPINYEQEVNTYKMTKLTFQKLYR